MFINDLAKRISTELGLTLSDQEINQKFVDHRNQLPGISPNSHEAKANLLNFPINLLQI